MTVDFGQKAITFGQMGAGLGFGVVSIKGVIEPETLIVRVGAIYSVANFH